MPTDEQPATHFYGYYISFDATGVEPVDHVLKAVADAGRGSHRTHDWAELGLEEEIQRAAGKAAEAFRARDVEVQALQRVLKDARFLIGKLAGWQGVDLSELDGEYDGVITRISAALAGEKGSSDD